MTNEWREYFGPRSIPEPNTGCVLFTNAWDGDGYGKAARWGAQMQAHRLSYMLACGREIPKGILVCHKCDTPACVNPEHLFLGTPAANSADMTRKGRSTWGRRNGRAKLSPEQVIEIRGSGEPQSALARRYGVSQGMVSMIKNNVVWRRL